MDFFICNESHVNVVNQLGNYLFSETFLALSRASPKDFSRTGALGFPRLIAFMLGGIASKVQIELNKFFANLANRADQKRIVSAQAFAQARMKITDKALPHLNDHFLHLVEKEFTFPKWHDFRVVAADATVLRLTQQFITVKGKKAVRYIQEAIGFALYLPGIEMTLAAALYLPNVGEREMLMNHLDKLRPNDILVLDRGYPAGWLIAALSQRSTHFCMRADGLNFGAIKQFRRSGLPEQIVTLPAPSENSAQPYGIVCKPTTVRLVRQVFGCQVHVLITSLLDLETYPAATFSSLYHSRWRIEEAFKRIKHRLLLEHTSGLTWLAAQQDLAAKILCDNINALAVYAASDSLDTDVRCRYIINRADSFVQIKATLGRWLLFGLAALENVDAVFGELIRNLVAVKPNRSYPRKSTQKPHKSHAYKQL